MQSYFISYHRVAEYLLADEIQPHEATSMLCAADSTDSTALKMSAATFTWEESRKDDEDQKPKFKRRITKKKQKAAAKAEAEAKAAADAAAATATEAGTDAPAEGAAKKDGDAESDKPAPFALHDITLDIPRGSLVAVVGSVGSGKSSFLSALIGGMRKTAGDSALFGSVAYCAQEPWILTGTIEENIVFGDDSVRARIPDAIAAACLDRDLEILPNGLGTQIGEKGINLSGGQKARVALARAIARDADIYLLDDPIAALDAHVGKKVFDDAICGVLRGKTVFLVTHQLHLLPKVDMVVVLDEGRIVETGAFRELMAREDGALSEIMKDYHFDDAETETAKEAIEADEGEESEAQQLAKAIKEFEEENAVEEDRRTGAVKLADYLSYFMAGGALYLPSIFVLLALLVAAGSAVQIVLAVWSDPGDTAWGLEKGKFLWIYIGLGLSVAVVNIISCLVIFHNGLNAAQVMHDRAMHALARAPMSFYDSQPVGRILNRMTSDIRNIDGITPQEIVVAINHVSGMVTSLAIVAFSAPYLLTAYREIKRLSSILVSPLTAHVSESLNGIPTIRAFGAVARFTESQHSKTDASNVGALLMECAELWVSVRLDLLSSTVALVLVILASYGAVSRTTIGASLVGTISFSESLRNMLIMLSNMAGNFNSVERVNHYARNLPAEAARELPADPKDGAWPTAGALAIRGLEIRYPSRPDHAVIQQLSLDIQPGEKVGVVGRTGSGKSTLMTALFRIMEASKGSIAIDGIDIAALGLKTLRSRLQIIPQEPVLFKGTVRSNLDFATKYSDDELWAALDLVGLKDFVGSLDGKLDAAIEENGANLSMGQRQLMCLCKAILAKPKVLIMDEATASVDAEADKRIQESIETQFAATTVLSIAHRLNTIAAFDRVLVLDGGRIAEFDAPHVLLGRAGSVFGEMVEATGAANAAVIRQIAADHFAKTH
nr:Multidrug resistance-associated protein 1 [Polyrhizophydium stewartii]